MSLSTSTVLVLFNFIHFFLYCHKVNNYLSRNSWNGSLFRDIM